MEDIQKEERELRFKELSKALRPKHDEVVRNALKALEKADDERLIVPLIALGMRNQDAHINHRIKALLYDMKLSAGQPVILEELEKMPPHPFRKTLIAAVWNARIPAMDHLLLFVKIAMEGTIEEAIECLTVIEEMEGEVNEEQVLDSLLLLNNYLSNPENNDALRRSILDEIRRIIAKIESSHQ